MKKRNKIIIYVLVCMIVVGAVIGGMWGGVREWQDSKHYVGSTEVPLNIAKILQSSHFVEGLGEVDIVDTSCPSGNVIIEYDFYSTRDYEDLDMVEGRCDEQLSLVIEVMFILSFLGSSLCCCVIGGIFQEIDIARKNSGK